MKKILFLTTLACSVAFTSCNEPDLVENTPNVINKGGTTEDGIADYKLSNVVMNDKVIALTDENAQLLSTQALLNLGHLKVQVDADKTFKAGDLLYVAIGNYTAFRKVTIVVDKGNGLFELSTVEGQLGEMFQGGEINVSLDLYKAAATKADNYIYDKDYELLNFTDNYNLGTSGINFSPSTKLKMSVHMSMIFNGTQLLPAKFRSYVEFKPNINPSFTFAGSSLNPVYDGDLTQYIPKEILDKINGTEFEIKLPINNLGIVAIPVKIGLGNLKLPVYARANLSTTNTNLSFGYNGTFKVGYGVDFNVLTATPVPIFESNLTFTPPASTTASCNIATNTSVSIAPIISVLNGLYKTSGEIAFGLRTETSAKASNGNNTSPTFASKGTLSSKMAISLKMGELINVPIEIVNEERELWNIGALEKSIIYSDLTWSVSSNSTLDLLLLSRMYETNFNLKYKYPAALPRELLISYDVYQEDNLTKIVSKKDVAITPANVTSNSFSFKMAIPFKSKFPAYQTKSYLKNIIIKDRSGNEYRGIYNSAKGVDENIFEINR